MGGFWSARLPYWRMPSKLTPSALLRKLRPAIAPEKDILLRRRGSFAVAFWLVIAAAACLALLTCVLLAWTDEVRLPGWAAAILAASALVSVLAAAACFGRMVLAAPNRSGEGDEAQGTEQQLARITSAAMDAIISIDERQRMVLFNPAAETMFGVSAKDAIGQPLDLVIPNRFRRAHSEHARLYMKTGATARRMGALGRISGLRANGEEFPIEASLSAITLGGQRLYTVIVRDISERLRLEQQLRTFIENAPAAIAMFDREMRYIAASRRWREDYGLSGDVIGLSHYDLFPGLPERRKDTHRRALAGETIKAGEDLLEQQNASPKWQKWEIQPWYAASGEIGGVTLFTENITAQKEAEEALRVSEARFRGVYEHAPSGIAIADLEWRFTSCNAALASMLGYTEEELRGLTLRDLIHPGDADVNFEGIERLVRQEAPFFESFCRCLKKEGTWLWAENTFSLLCDVNGEPSSIFILLADRSERRRAEERQRMLMRELAHRGKNLLAVIQAIARHSLSKAATLEDGRIAFAGRLQALARTYSSLTGEAFEGARLDEIVSAELDPFFERLKVRGPKIMLGAKVAQTFALVIHELATNAAKYGALSAPRGTVAVTWKASEAAGARRFQFEWVETGGPAVSPPSRQGFGTSLISSVASAEFDCTPEIVYGPEGFRYSFEAPLEAMGETLEEPPARRKLRSRVLAELYDAWDSERDAGGGPPDFQQFDRERFAKTGGLTLAEVSGDGSIRFIETGEALMEHLSNPMKESPISSAEASSFTEAYRRCAGTAQPRHEILKFDFSEGDTVYFERLLVPYSSGSSHVTHVVGIAVFHGDSHGLNAQHSHDR